MRITSNFNGVHRSFGFKLAAREQNMYIETNGRVAFCHHLQLVK